VASDQQGVAGEMAEPDVAWGRGGRVCNTLAIVEKTGPTDSAPCRADRNAGHSGAVLDGAGQGEVRRTPDNPFPPGWVSAKIRPGGMFTDPT
jgi:hypothetical protein